jgi:hypothetical protein
MSLVILLAPVVALLLLVWVDPAHLGRKGTGR